MEAGDATACYTSGSVAGAVFGTLLTVLVLAGLAYLFWRFYWRRRRGKHLSLETGEKGENAATAGPLGDRFAFDNPCFLSEDASPNRKNKKGTPKIKVDGTQGKAEKNVKSDKGGGTGRLGKWTSWSPLGALVGSGGVNSKGNEKRRAFDDSCIGEPQRVSVSLRGHDFTGLGFNVCGNMRDGIFVRDVLHRGPASESGQITAGDRIVSLGISFEHMVFEDALTILSYASPYEVLLQVEKGASPPGSTLLAGTEISSGQTSLKRTAVSTTLSGAGASQSPDKQRAIICHPFYRSQSIDDLDKIGKASINAKRAQQIAEMTRIKSNTQDEMNHGSTREGTAEVDSRSHHKAMEDEKLLRREAPTMLPSEEDTKRDGETGPHHTGYQKFGVRVLPMGNPVAGAHSQGIGKVHNPGHQNSSAAMGSRPDRAEEVSITIATPEPQKQNERNSMIEMGVGKEMKVVAPPHNPSDKNPPGKSQDDGMANSPKEETLKEPAAKMKVQVTEEIDGTKKKENATKNPHDNMVEDKIDAQDEKMEEQDKMNNEGMIIDVPEEVCMAGLAAVTNRKMGGSSQYHKEEEEEATKHNGRIRYSSGGSGDEGSEDGDRVLGNTPGNGGKRRAPAPPPELSEMNPEEGEVPPLSPEGTAEEETPLCIPFSEERKKKGGTRIELGLDHITIHHQPQTSEEIVSTNTEEGEAAPSDSVGVKEEKETAEGDNSMTTGEENSSDTEADDAPNAKRTVTTVSGGKAASLGDLSRLEGGEVHRPPRMRTGPSSVTGGGEGVVLERAVSLDLGNAEEVVTCPPPSTSIGSAKKRKAPAPPTPVSRGNSNGSDEIDGSSRAETGLDGDEYGKEPRLIGVGSTDTFGRRLKKSSDWGTMEEALLAGGSPSSSSTSSSTSAGRTILHLGSVPSFIPMSTSDGAPHDFGAISSEVSTTRNAEAPQGGSELMVSMLKKINSHPEISLQSSVITSSDTDADTNSTVTSTSEMPKTNEDQANPSNSAGGNRVIVTTSASVEEAIDSTTYPSQQNNRGIRGIVHLEAADTANMGGEGEKAEPSGGESFHSSFQRAREFFEREDEKPAVTPMEEDNDNDDDDEVTSSPPSLPTSPMPVMQPSSPLSLHSTTTYISSIEDIPVVPGLLDGREFGVTTQNTPGAQHHITEIQVRSIDEDGKKVETREVVVSQDGDEAFGRVGDIISSAIERNSLSSSGENYSVAPMNISKGEGELQSSMYINESFPATEGTKAIHRIGYKLTSSMPEASYQVRKPSNNPTDNGSIETSTRTGSIMGSSDQVIEDIGSMMDAISSSGIMGDTGSPIVQIRMREGPSGWIPYRHRHSQGEERGDSKKEMLEGSNEPPKVPKKKPPVPPRKDASNSPSSESPSRSDASIGGSSFSSSVKTVVEVPMSFTKRLVQVHETRSDDGFEGMEQPMHRISEREVIQITPQELDKVMMSHSQFLSHKRGEPSPSKSEQWLPGTTPIRSVVHRIVEHLVTDEDGTRKIITETSVGDGSETLTEVIESEGGGTSTPPNGIVATVPEGNALDAASELHKQNMSVTHILVDPEFASNLGRSSDGVTKTINVANLQLSGIEGKPSIPSSGLQT
ncbi:uncharacterized protein [Hetaerina americana]|uniref:uncharacterized protein n=1 Tax=Hetaerina americana TaxID=62018 RepID=UPI003A7F5162